MTSSATAQRLETVSTFSQPAADMVTGRETTLMTSIAQDTKPVRADMISGAKTCMMTSIADI